MINIDCSTLPVMTAHCKTCPFKDTGDGIWQNVELANQVIERTLFKGHQICHGTEGKNRKPNNRCKGAFDHNNTIYERFFGMLNRVQDVQGCDATMPNINSNV